MPEKSRKTTKKVQEKEAKKPSLNKKLLVISITLAVIIILGAVIYQLFWRASEIEVKFPLKAAIIDQLSEDENLRNQTFVDRITTILEEYNFSVAYYDYTKTNVTFFKGLAKAGFGIIILRLHSALRIDGSTVDFFTSEPYSLDKYEKEQNEGLLVNGTIIYSGRQYFAFTSKFVEKLEGTFPKSIIIAMGCQTLNQTAGQPMAKAFCDKKGAKVYIGWSSWVSATHSDEETIKLMQRLLYEDKTLGKAVEEANPDLSCVPPSYLGFYPQTVRNLKISDLIEEAQTSSASTKSKLFKGFYIVEMLSVKRFNSLATVIYNWFRRFSPVKFAVFNFLTSSANTTSSRTSFIHFSKSPR
ncbi:MAG: hypothetical protein QW629_02180 [Candidatus Bathyarchaeia archaeon]